MTIAEIGCTHIGSLDRAKELARLAKLSGADYVKLQKRNPEESTNKDLWDKPHPNQMYSYGDTYLEHRKNVELPIGDHVRLSDYCKEIGIGYATSVWDMTSAKEVVEQINPDFIKIPSACNQNDELFDYLVNSYSGKIHISMGMLDAVERKEFIDKVFKYRDRCVVYHCTSGYPVPFEQLYLNEIKSLSTHFYDVGFSNHGYGISTEPVAYSLGARYFERHFIDDRMFKHTDASCSLEPNGFSKMVRDIKAAQKALQDKPNKLDDIEQVQKDKLSS